MKSKNKIVVWFSLFLAIVTAASGLAGIASISHPTVHADPPASAAIVSDVYNSSSELVQSNGTYQCEAVINKPVPVNTAGTGLNGANGYAFGHPYMNPPSGDPADTLNAANSGANTIAISFRGAGNSNSDSACGKALGFAQSSVGTNGGTMFYGAWNTGRTISTNFLNPYALVYVSAVVSVAKKTVTFTLPSSVSFLNNNSPASKLERAGTFTLNLSDPDNVLANKAWFPSASGGGGGSTSVGTGACFEGAATSDTLNTCINGAPKASFANGATILYAGDTYTATAWGNNVMTYTLTTAGDTTRLTSGKIPELTLSTTGTGGSSLDINMDDKGNLGDIQDIAKALQKSASAGNTVKLGFTNYSSRGDQTTGTVTALTDGLDIFAAYYPKSDTAALVFGSAGNNESPYFGTYTRQDATHYALTTGGFAGCKASLPMFQFASDPHGMSSTYDGIVPVTWQLPANDSACDYGNVPIRMLIEPANKDAPTPAAPQTNTPNDGPNLNCNVSIFNPLSWFLCPLTEALQTVVGGLDDAINNYLKFDTSQLDQYKPSWDVVRNISLALIVVGALFAIISQAAGLEILDAYTLRKVLPRVLVAAIGISLAWPLLAWFITLTNDLGTGIRQLIYSVPIPGKDQITIGGGAQATSVLLGGAIGAVLGFAGILSFAATAALAAAVAFLVLTLRQIVILMLIIFSPIAIVCYVLPNTQKVWHLWWESFSKALLMFPIIVGFIAMGRVFAAVTSAKGGFINSIVAFTAYFAPYFLIPFTFKLAGGAISSIGGMVNDKSRGGFDRLKGFRGKKAQENIAGMQAGTRFNNRGLNALTSRATTRNLGFGARGSAAYNQKMDLAAMELAKSGAGQALQHNDHALRAMTYGSEAEARQKMAKDFAVYQKDDDGNYLQDHNGNRIVDQAKTQESVDRGVAAVKASGGFGRARQVWAAQQLSNTATGYDSLEQVGQTIARVSHGNENQMDSIAGNINSGTKAVGRPDLAPGFSELSKLAKAESAGNATSGMYEKAHQSATGAMDGLSTMRGKPAAVQTVASNLATRIKNKPDDEVAKRKMHELINGLSYGNSESQQHVIDNVRGLGDAKLNEHLQSALTMIQQGRSTDPTQEGIISGNPPGPGA